jgi:hypothetical protein
MYRTVVTICNAQRSLYVPHSGHYMYRTVVTHYMHRQFNIQQFYVLSTHCIYCFVWISEQTAIISLYNINWLVGFYNRNGVCLLRGTSLTVICVNLSRPMANVERSIWCGMRKMHWSLLRNGASNGHRMNGQAAHCLSASSIWGKLSWRPLSCRKHVGSSGSRSRFLPWSSSLYRNSVSGTPDRFCFLCAVSVLCETTVIDQGMQTVDRGRCVCGPFEFFWQPAKRCKTRLKQ